jgi:endonuclease/exonuclease/phosphatase family metal-dependent hydrolase
MKLMQLNVWNGKIQYRLLGYLREKQHPDIICMQEVNKMDGTADAFFATLDEIKKASGLDYEYMSPVMDYKLMNRKVVFGNAVLSRFAYEDQNTVFTYGEYTPDFDYATHDSNIRNIQHVIVKGVNIINHHGFFVRDSKDGNEETLRQVQKIIDYTSNLTGPIIICGDFNLSPDSRSIAMLNEKFTNLTIQNNIPSTYSQLNWDTQDMPWSKIVSDYIFVNDRIKVNDFYAEDEILSDHKALILDFDI